MGYAQGVVAAALRALVAWIVLYAIVLQVLVVWKWDSVHREVVENVVVEKEVVQIQESPPPQATVVAAATAAVSPEELEASRKRTALLLEEMKDAQKRQTDLLDRIDHKRHLAEHHVQQAMLPHHDDDAAQENETKLVPPKHAHLLTLLQIQSLSTMSNEELQQIFALALEELRGIRDQAQTLDWAVVNHVLQFNYKRSPPEPMQCVASTALGDSKESSSSSLARLSDLMQLQKEVTQQLQKRTNPETLPKVLSTQRVLAVLEDQIHERLAIASSELREGNDAAVDTSVDLGNCIEKEEVVDMLEEGLQALKRKQNVQAVLSRYVAQLRPEEESSSQLILDAMLPPPARPYVPPPDKVSLRQVLDSNLLQQSAKVLDSLVDLVSGSNDMLDQAIDYLEREGEGGSVGRTLVSKLLHSVGNIYVPNPERFTTKAGILRETL